MHQSASRTDVFRLHGINAKLAIVLQFANGAELILSHGPVYIDYVDEVVYVTEGGQDNELDDGTIHLLHTTPMEVPVYQGAR